MTGCIGRLSGRCRDIDSLTHRIGAVGIGLRVELLPKLMPVITGAAVVKTMKSVASIAVGKDGGIAVPMTCVKGTLGQLILNTGRNRDLLGNLDIVTLQELLKISSLKGMRSRKQSTRKAWGT